MPRSSEPRNSFNRGVGCDLSSVVSTYLGLTSQFIFYLPVRSSSVRQRDFDQCTPIRVCQKIE